MFDQNRVKHTSKFLSLILRHKPGLIGLETDKNGWAGVNELLEKMALHGHSITHKLLEYVVDTNAKKRFAFNSDKSKIRASQGHSIAIDLQLILQEPPEYLYHGTSQANLPSILLHGLNKKERQHVHLSSDIVTAIQVGQRHGKPVVLTIKALQMHGEEFVFYFSENKVWLTGNVPIQYIVPPGE